MSLKSSTHSISAWHLYSEGVVAENKPLSTNDCLVTPYEVFPMMDGDLGDDIYESEVEGVDSFDVPFKLTVKTGTTIKCKWYQRGSNRHTAPDVRRGERVEIWRFGDSKEFYWVSKGLDDHLRRLETVRFLFNADPDGLGDNPPSPENSYVFEISTHDKLITLQTSILNGEPFEYVIQLNTDQGYFTIKDDIGNYVTVDSQERSIRLQNADGSFIDLDKENINAYAKGNISVEALKDIIVKCANLNWNASGAAKFKTGGNFEVEAPKIKFKGDFEVDGKSEFKDEMKANGIKSPKPIQGPSNTI